MILCCCWYCSTEGGDPLEFFHHFVHLVCVNGRIIPCHAVACLAEHPTDLPITHAADELSPWGVVFVAELDACPSGVVQELIVADPEGCIPCFVVCPTVVGGCGHVVRSCVLFNYTARGVPDYPADDTCSSVTYIHFIHASVPSFHMVQSSFHCLA